jgi:catechol 2,3-dioxygenase-like lactoylglutathione lyase family enzyme
VKKSTPKIRHLAIITLDPERLAQFYEQTFDMRRLPPKSKVPGTKAIFMTDGYLTLALLENKAEGKPPGLNHFGWQVDDQDEIARRMAQFGIKGPAKRPADRPYAETRGTDPDGNNFDLSVQGYGVGEEAAAKEKAPATV